MKFERSNVEFPLWRKKVDTSLFEHKGTTIPAWAVSMWRLHEIFSGCISKKDTNAAVPIIFADSEFAGWVTIAEQGRKTPAYRLWFSDDLCLNLKHTFLMSYMRSLEQGLSKDKQIEKTIPFWEFLDIEFDEAKRVFKFVAYYTQEPSFPQLFRRLIGSPPLQKIDAEIKDREKDRIFKQEWRPREQLEYELGAYNVIYYLIDTENKFLYIGEAKDLVRRLLQGHSNIPKWNFFRYDVLPDTLSPFRITLERMMIRDFAELLSNSRALGQFSISDYKLVNDKIDVR